MNTLDQSKRKVHRTGSDERANLPDNETRVVRFLYGLTETNVSINLTQQNRTNTK